jgi:hypothetical protein
MHKKNIEGGHMKEKYVDLHTRRHLYPAASEGRTEGGSTDLFSIGIFIMSNFIFRSRTVSSSFIHQ